MGIDALRHRLLEGVLLRLARRPDTEAFVLRGGMLLRHWFRPDPRGAEDLDLIATFPFDAGGAARRFLPTLAEGADDGVIFDAAGAWFEGIFLDTGAPGVRVFASGTADGTECDFRVDITGGPFPRPGPIIESIPTVSGGTARLWVCRPETVVAQKVQALCHLGMLGWRPKDLDDLRLLLEKVPLDADDLRRAIAAYLADLGRTGPLFGPDSWWNLKFSSARWLDFADGLRERDVPRELAVVAADIARRLVPILEDLP